MNVDVAVRCGIPVVNNGKLETGYLTMLYDGPAPDTLVEIGNEKFKFDNVSLKNGRIVVKRSDGSWTKQDLYRVNWNYSPLGSEIEDVEEWWVWAFILFPFVLLMVISKVFGYNMITAILYIFSCVIAMLLNAHFEC